MIDDYKENCKQGGKLNVTDQHFTRREIRCVRGNKLKLSGE